MSRTLTLLWSDGTYDEYTLNDCRTIDVDMLVGDAEGDETFAGIVWGWEYDVAEEDYAPFIKEAESQGYLSVAETAALLEGLK